MCIEFYVARMQTKFFQICPHLIQSWAGQIWTVRQTWWLGSSSLLTAMQTFRSTSILFRAYSGIGWCDSC